MSGIVTDASGAESLRGNYTGSADTVRPHDEAQVGPVRRVVAYFDQTGLLSDHDIEFPVGAKFISAKATYDVAVSATKSFQFGLVASRSSGFTADPNAFITGSTAPAAGATDTGAGVQIGAETTLLTKLSVSPQGAPTAGAGVVVVEYVNKM